MSDDNSGESVAVDEDLYDMEVPLADGQALSRALVLALAGVRRAGFSEEEGEDALETLARAALTHIESAYQIWDRLIPNMPDHLLKSCDVAS